MAQHEESFKVVQNCNIEPLIDTTKPFPSPTSLPLTFFDLLWLRFPPVERLFFYELTNSTTFFYETLLPNLKHSLSLTLQHFLPLVGNITWPSDSSKPIINYVKGDSISFNVVESKASFKDLSSHHCEASKRHHLIPLLKNSHEKASLLAIQVTLFPNNGFCIGITTHHAALDGKSSTTFMKSWSYVACSNSNLDSSFLSLPENLTPLFDRSLIEDHHSGISEAYVDALMKHGGPNNRSLKIMNFSSPMKHDVVKSLFELTPSNIQKLKEHGKNDMKMNVINLSTFLVTSAYVLACLVKAQQPKVEKVIFIFAIDCRSRLDPSISTMYIGNCIAGKKIVFETKNLVGKNGFVNALEGINKALNSVKDVGVLNGAENWVSNMSSGMEGKIYSIAGSPRFEFYSIDFGFGKPKKVDMTSTDKSGAFSLSESRNNNGGIEIGLALSKEEMEAFSTLFVQGLESI
ncbi:putative isoflavone-7-O-beta-glucoside 6''-O-malonyltransferase [Medicago truncatula]|uniref:Malonyl-CoA:isoflavone 7-O-glucoside malonyltransferase n=1 Tax=Medicago truncatula TaxID=3880 RepID=A0A072UH54_MEDTR|nr:phenolic glucoside malonyltransferase 2 [Medicago truncatula]KEH25130.1 malonyl-CoA:isoflavone 7-O-glucoside malonyltransferase [Medicago truncatula]RHN50244.1 putative isoflavone-7-O-beta-glucoside 6''-O-malonyltransferase [Medicago truncatula]